jgi:hypothetical protein
MAIPLIKLLTLVMLAAGGWAILATLFTPPLTSGWREGVEAAARRWTRAVIVLGLSATGLVIVWLLVVRLLWDHGPG